MARRVTSRRVWVSTAAAWLFGFVSFLPILWMVLTSFKTELEAFAMPPTFLFFHWTTENYATVQGRSDYVHHALNSIIVAGGSTLLALLIAIPAAWSMAFAPTKRTKDILLWMLSTKMMPSVGVLVPIYLIYRDFGLLDTRGGLVMILCLGNLPIVIWMLFTYFKEIPKDILEAARMDGATIGRELIYVLTPMAIPGLASTLLLNFILIYLIYRDFGLLDTRGGLVMILCLGNLPIVIWMLFTYFKEIPKDILEAARMDGATIGRELIYVLTPMAIPGLASTLLLNFI